MDTDIQIGARHPAVPEETRIPGLPVLRFLTGLAIGAAVMAYGLLIADPWTATRITVEPAPSPYEGQMMVKFEDGRHPRTMGDPVTETRPGPSMLIEYGQTSRFTMSKPGNELFGLLALRSSRSVCVEMPASLTSGPLVLTHY